MKWLLRKLFWLLLVAVIAALSAFMVVDTFALQTLNRADDLPCPTYNPVTKTGLPCAPPNTIPTP